MRIAVIGAGLAGVMTAYELARAGHDAIVYERRGSIAAEGSFAPACVNAPGLGFALSALGTRANLPAGAMARPRAWPWLVKSRRIARQPAHLQRLQAMATLARLSLERLRQVEDAHELAYERQEGVLAVLRQPHHAAGVQAMLPTLDTSGARWVDADEARRLEPGLDGAFPLHGALHWPRGQTANGRQFAHALKTEAQRLGARFLFHQEVMALDAPAGNHGSVELRSRHCIELADSGLPAPASTLLDDLSPHFDAVVLCSATAARRMLPRQPLPLGLACVHTVTAPLRAGDGGEAIGPCGALLDLTTGISIARMGDRLRVAGRARCGRPPAQPDEHALSVLYRGLDACFPGAARTARAQAWAGRQCALADGLPAVGGVGHGVWLNLGHGAHSWAWAPATAGLVAGLIGGKSPACDPALLDPARLR